MEKKEVKIDNPVALAGVTLLPLVEVSLSYWRRDSRLSIFGTKQPVSVVVISPSAKKAFRISGEEVPLEQLMQEVPGIREILGEI